MAALLARGAGRGCRLGDLLPDRPAPQAADLGPHAARLGAARHRPAGVAGRRGPRRGRRQRRDGERCCSPSANDAADASAPEPLPLHRWLEERILPLRGQPAEHQYAEVCGWWQELPRGELFVLNKLLTGAFRVGVSRAPGGARARRGSRPAARDLAHRLMGRLAAERRLRIAALIAEGDATIARGPIRSSSPRRSRPTPQSLGAARRLAGRVEVGRHPRPADPPPRRDLPVVARRGADHRALSRADPGGGTAAAMASCSTARCWPGTRRRRCRSPRCRRGSAAIA